MTADHAPPTRAARRAATAERILDAARHEFAAHGYDATTIRAVARRAEVDPSLVIQHFGAKAALFRSAVALDTDAPAAAADHLLDVVAARTASLPPEMATLVRSMLTVPEAGAAMKARLDERVTNLAAGIGGPDAELRAAVAVSTVLGLTIARHFLELDALADADPADVARLAGPLVVAPTDPDDPDDVARLAGPLVVAPTDPDDPDGVARLAGPLVVAPTDPDDPDDPDDSDDRTT